MSGILLPGQERKPQGEVKIELPKGAAAPKKESPAEPAQPAPPPAAAPSEAPAAAPQSRGPGANLLFPPRGAQIRCPACGQTYAIPVFTIVDLGANPELRAPLLGGQLNMAVCPSCGAGGPLGAPLMVHDPAHNYLGVYVPMEAGRDDLQRQRAIGDLTQALLRKIPAESRRGYLLQPIQYTDWQRFMEKLWEFEGVTPEMLRRQREQSELLQRLAGLANDDKAFEIVLERSKGLVDRDFFNLLDQLILMGRAQRAAQNELAALMAVREKLLAKTEAGQAVRRQQEKIRDLISQLTPNTSREEALRLVIDAWAGEDGKQVVGTLAIAAAGLFDYQFLMLLSEKIGGASGDERKQLEELRQFLLQMQEQLAARRREEQQAASANAQAILQEILQAPDAVAALREHAEEIDEDFLAFLAANIQQAERNKATAAVRRLRAIYEAALRLMQENLPPELALLNQLLTAQDDATVRQLVRDNRALVTREFVESMRPLEQEMRGAGQTELADRIKTLRGQLALMV